MKQDKKQMSYQSRFTEVVLQRNKFGSLFKIGNMFQNIILLLNIPDEQLDPCVWRKHESLKWKIMRSQEYCNYQQSGNTVINDCRIQLKLIF